MTSIHFRDAQIIALVYDVMNDDTIDSLKIWLDDIDQKSKVKHVIFFIGNKADLLEEDEDNWEIDDGVKELMEKYNISHLFTSAKNNVNIKELFQKSVDLAIQRNIFENSERDRGTHISEMPQKKSDSKGCC